MNRPRKGNRSSKTSVSALISRSWCVLFFLYLFLPIAFASDFGLVNPAEKDFAEFRTSTRSTDNFARRNPALNERTLPPPQRTEEPIRQVSAFDSDPFPVAAQSVPPQVPIQQFSFDWGAAPVVQNYPQHDVIPYDPNAFGYVNPHYGMQDMQAILLAQQFAQQQFAQQQHAQQQFAQYPQPFHQGHMMPYANQFMNPQADMYTQFGNVIPSDTWNPQMGHQNVPDNSAMYQAFLLQMAQQQAEEAQARANNGNNNGRESTDAPPQADPQWTLNNLMPLRVTSPLGETLLVGAKTISPFATPSGPDKGVGMPLVGRSWLDHPYYFGGFVGYIHGSKELVSNMIEQKSGGTGGFTFGYNFNDYWGLESRAHFSSIDIYDTDYAKELFEENFRQQFPDMAVPTLTTRTNELAILDVAVHYYPLGNAKWRPYCKYGLGIGRQRFVNTFGYENKADIVTMPLGVGVRYWWHERLAIQADLLNNVVFASGIAKTQHNVSFMVGLTYAFGSGRRTHPIHYWPATPSMGSKW